MSWGVKSSYSIRALLLVSEKCVIKLIKETLLEDKEPI